METRYAEVWCRVCPAPADGDDGLCEPHREGVPSGVTGGSALLYLDALRSRRTRDADRTAARARLARSSRRQGG